MEPYITKAKRRFDQVQFKYRRKKKKGTNVKLESQKLFLFLLTQLKRHYQYFTLLLKNIKSILYFNI